MILDVVKYGTPILRKKGDRIAEVTPTIKKLISDMKPITFTAFYSSIE